MKGLRVGTVAGAACGAGGMVAPGSLKAARVSSETTGAASVLGLKRNLLASAGAGADGAGATGAGGVAGAAEMTGAGGGAGTTAPAGPG